MCKSDWLYQRCADAAEKSPMQFTLGAVLVKGGKVISTGYNHQRTRYDGRDTSNRTPISMHAEMHAIYNACGSLSPAFSQQVQSGGGGGGQRHDRAKVGCGKSGRLSWAATGVQEQEAEEEESRQGGAREGTQLQQPQYGCQCGSKRQRIAQPRAESNVSVSGVRARARRVLL